MQQLHTTRSDSNCDCSWTTDLLLSTLCQSGIVNSRVGEGWLADCCCIKCRLPMPYEMQHLQDSRNSVQRPHAYGRLQLKLQYATWLTLRSDLGLNKGKSLRPGDCAASMLQPGASSRDSSGVAAAVAQSEQQLSCSVHGQPAHE